MEPVRVLITLNKDGYVPLDPYHSAWVGKLGTIVWCDKSAFGGYQVAVELDEDGPFGKFIRIGYTSPRNDNALVCQVISGDIRALYRTLHAPAIYKSYSMVVRSSLDRQIWGRFHTEDGGPLTWDEVLVRITEAEAEKRARIIAKRMGLRLEGNKTTYQWIAWDAAFHKSNYFYGNFDAPTPAYKWLVDNYGSVIGDDEFIWEL